MMMTTQTRVNVNDRQISPMRLPRTLSPLETWGFGLTSHINWVSIGPAMHAALGPNAIFVWLPAVLVGVLLNLQVKRLGEQWPEMSGGTPNYITRLLRNYPLLGCYAAIAYFLSWAVYPSVNAIVLTELIKTNLEPLGIALPETVLRIGFTLIAYIVAFSGSRALAILHAFFIIPAVGFLLLFGIQGMGWLAFSPESPGLFPSSWPTLTFVDWAKWSFFAIYGASACETASSFVADSRRPTETLRFLSLAAGLIPLVYLGNSWVLMRLATSAGLGDDSFKNLLAAGLPFWGHSASLIVTLLLASSSLLSCATCVSNSPRVLYQLALDGHLSPVFTFVSRRGVLEPSLICSFLISLIGLVWGDVTSIVVVGCAGYLVTLMALYLGLWLRRGLPEVRWPWWAACFFILDGVVLVVGGLNWSREEVTIGLLFPVAVLAVDAAIRRISFAPFHRAWWIERDRTSFDRVKDFVVIQVVILIVLVCGAAAIAWGIRDNFERIDINANHNILVILLISIAFFAIAIACWTSLPQVAAIAEARERAESLFITALDTVPDTIIVLDEHGVIHQANPAAETLFGVEIARLIGSHLHNFLSELPLELERWPNRSEQKLRRGKQGLCTIEATISRRSSRKFQEYIVILRDISDRKQSEEILRRSEETARNQASQLEATLQELKQTQSQLIQTEKMSSLGQLVAGVAHEINNPVNFIHGNLTHIGNYTQDLLSLINLYQQGYSCTAPEIQTRLEDIEFEFLLEDMPKTLDSMKVGTDRIRQIVLTLRNFSRLDEAQMKPVNIHDGIESTLLILQNRFKAKPERASIEIIKNYGNLPEVECYAGQLNQVFMNLLTNAIDALEDADKTRTTQEIKEPLGTIIIQTEVLDKNWVKIRIKDDGLGMTEIVKARVFDPFFTTKPIGQGTGLGLSISYQIVVDKHGGRMQCISELGVGTEFWIDIPIRQSAIAPALASLLNH